MPAGFIGVIQVVFVSIVAVLCWMALTDNRGWWFFIVLWISVLIWLHLTKLTLPPLRWQVLPGFLLFFSKQVVLGAFDVARRALSVKPRFAPRWHWYAVSLSQPASRQLLASMISLLPGTCSAQVRQYQQKSNQILLHVLDEHTDWRKAISALEQQLARLLYLEHPAEAR